MEAKGGARAPCAPPWIRLCWRCLFINQFLNSLNWYHFLITYYRINMCLPFTPNILNAQAKVVTSHYSNSFYRNMDKPHVSGKWINFT